MGCGERLSAFFLATLFQDRGVPAEYIDLSQILHYEAQDPIGVTVASVQQLSQFIAEKVSLSDRKVPVSFIWSHHLLA